MILSFPKLVKELLAPLSQNDYPVLNTRLFVLLTLRFLEKIDSYITKHLNYWAYHYLQKLFGFPMMKLRFYKANGYWSNLNNPISFNEKIIYQKLHDYNPLLPIITDKYRVRNYVLKLIGDQYFVPLLQVVDRVEEINFESLPNEFIIKLNFGSGFNIIVRNKQKANLFKIREQLSQWMLMKYGHKTHAWYFQETPRKILIEKLLLDHEGNFPYDYKLYVFHGEVKFIHVDFDRFGEASRTFYDPNWNRLSFSKNLQSIKDISKPDNLQEMIDISCKLANDFSFMRVDLYNCSNVIYFSELTAFPACGLTKFDPPNVDFELGKLWAIARLNET